MKNKSVPNCRFVHHAKLHCIVITLNRLFKSEFERGELEKGRKIFDMFRRRSKNFWYVSTVLEKFFDMFQRCSKKVWYVSTVLKQVSDVSNFVEQSLKCFDSTRTKFRYSLNVLEQAFICLAFKNLVMFWPCSNKYWLAVLETCFQFELPAPEFHG